MLSRLYFRASYEGLENVPATGAFVLAPVHRSNLDFALMSVLTKRRMRYMGKESLWKYPWFGRIIAAMGAYPVSRGTADREALRRTIEVLGEGDGLVLFPEGTRRSGPVVEELYEGAAFVASRAGVPIVPVGIGGTERSMPKGARFPRPVKVRVIVGPPLYPPPLPEGRRHPSRKADPRAHPRPPAGAAAPARRRPRPTPRSGARTIRRPVSTKRRRQTFPRL